MTNQAHDRLLKKVDLKLLVGAYAAYSSSRDKEICWPVLEEVTRLGFVRGLEIPVSGQFQIFDSAPEDQIRRFVELLVPGWRSIVTLIPGTMQVLQDAPHFGLASDERGGRNQAIESVRFVHRQVMEINQKRGELSVESVALHSAPVASAGSSVDSLILSLQEICDWDWQGVSLLLEHCDRFQNQHRVAKGFLSLEDEIRAWQALSEFHPQRKLQLLINWGRSALEARDPDHPERQIKRLTAHELTTKALGCLMFSGVTARDPLYGEWLDFHAPFSSDCPNSLMTRERVSKCLAALGHEVRVGFKIQALPASMSLDERIGMIRRSGEFLLDCFPRLLSKIAF